MENEVNNFQLEKIKILKDYEILKIVENESWKIHPKLIPILDEINKNNYLVTTYSCFSDIDVFAVKNYITIKSDNNKKLELYEILFELTKIFHLEITIYHNYNDSHNYKTLREKLNLSDYWMSNEYQSNSIHIEYVQNIYDSNKTPDFFWCVLKNELCKL